MNTLITRLNTSPGLIFKVDALGAAISLITLILISYYQATTVGLPAYVLLWLAFIAGALCVFSTTCAIWGYVNRRQLLLKIIAAANLTYCLLTWAFVLYHKQEVTPIGWGYFLGETAIICLLVWVETKISQIP